MKTDNELIAEFMGYFEACDTYGADLLFINGTPERVQLGGKLYYGASWDWLMPVIEKLEREAPCRVVIDRNTVRIVGDRKFKVQTLRKINSAYQAVVQAIKWYSKRKQ